MKKPLFLLALCLCCACEEDKTIDPTLMPEASMTGENTLGCLIDGWVYTSGRFGTPSATTHSNEKGNHVTIRASVDLFTTLEFTLTNPSAGSECTYTNTIFDGGEREDGKALITRKDGNVISGTFSGGSITQGRFDIKYVEENNVEATQATHPSPSQETVCMTTAYGEGCLNGK
ncbi:hypothetical protein [Bacteroides rodentium]